MGKKGMVDSLPLSVKSCKFRANLCYFRWLKPTRRRVRSLIPSGLCYLKVMACLGPIKFHTWFFEDSKVPEWQILKLILFRSLIKDGKKFLRKLWLKLISSKLFEFLVICILLVVGNLMRGAFMLLYFTDKTHSS